jgi:HAMP domain-containing protein
MTKSKRKSQRPARRPGTLALPMLLGFALLGVLALLAWRGFARPTSTLSSGTPSLKADRQKVDLGDVRLGQPVAVAFALTNTGDAPLRFTEAPYVEVAAGC